MPDLTDLAARYVPGSVTSFGTWSSIRRMSTGCWAV
jgi:hypothetical protein